ncbi:MAG: metalloregulator ArsR/SmtB family transcription factor [Trueperaceae bacterium]
MVLSPAQEGTELKAKLFRGLADPTRLSILDAIRHGSMCVSDVVAATGHSQSNVSNHLACLKDCGLVSSERRGRNIHYRTSEPRVNELLELGEQLLADVAHGIYACTRYAGREDSREEEAQADG